MNAAPALRAMRVPDDCAGVAGVCSACFPDWPVTAEEVADAEARRSPARLHRALVAVDGETMVGFGFIQEPDVAAREGRLRLRILVPPDRRRTGIGSALYDALCAIGNDAGATELVTEAEAADEGAAFFLARRGFVEYHRRIENRLSMADVPATAIGRAIDRHADAFFASGVRIATFRQLRLAHADAARRLYDLDATLWADVPFGLTGALPSYEGYLAAEIGHPDFLPAATFIALDGDQWIGVSALVRGPGFLLNSMTGVLRAWRGRGLARWLKLHTLRHALERGAAGIRTFNDSINPAILALNASFGFRAANVQVRYRKDLR
jgi:GNAT superfamily N-acetyltransferase